MERERFIATMDFLLVRADMGIWIDESNKDRKAMRRRYGWAPKGTQAEVSNYFNQDRRYTLIAACDYIGFILEACDTVMHTVHEKQEEGTVDTERFVQYILTKFVPILGNYSRQEPRSVVFMDNCSIHLDPRVEHAIMQAGARLVYTAPYCPEPVPIEYIFSKWKAFLKRHYQEFRENWYRIIVNYP